MVADRMNSLKFSGKNERIEYEGTDEVSVLVQRYNDMVEQLEISAEKLAVSEREAAWKEMARQVAHEIRNPLTPMKLSLQFLQRSLESESGPLKDRTEKVTSTILSQIEHLSRIAHDFQQFANISQSNPERMSLAGLLNKIRELYGGHPNLQLHLFLPYSDELDVYADSTQMNRLFTNLMQNAVEATSDKADAKIVIRATRNGEFLQVEVTDNGTGIDEESQEKIFKPNFTTKKSGTGLGLAMSRAIAENAGGSIDYTTVPEEGTTFVVRLPVLP